MREAIGNTFIVNLLLIFIAVMSALLIGSIGYSKAFKVKNRIIYILEKYEGYTAVAQTEINASLRDIGYPIAANNRQCPSPAAMGADRTVYGGSPAGMDYHYCIYEYENIGTQGKGHYYGVITFMHFDIPLIGNYLQFQVRGKTRTMLDITDFNN